MSTDLLAETRPVLATACARAGLDACGAEPIRFGENALFRLSGRIVARIARAGQQTAAQREVHIARWLAKHDVPAVRPTGGIDQPVVVDSRAVTFWDDLGPHRIGTSTELAEVLRQLHGLLPPSTFGLPLLDPFVRIEQRINASTVFADTDRAWLHQRLIDLRHRYATLPAGQPHCVVHGDASNTNVAVTTDGTVTLLDLERCTVGPPEWDLTSMAVELGYEWISTDTYEQFCQRYGLDVTTWAGYEVLRDIRELRMASWLGQQASEQPQHCPEALHRIECLQGKHGPRPWAWTGL